MIDKKEYVKICKNCTYHTFSLQNGIECSKSETLKCVSSNFSMFKQSDKTSSIADDYANRSNKGDDKEVRSFSEILERKIEIDKEISYTKVKDKRHIIQQKRSIKSRSISFMYGIISISLILLFFRYIYPLLAHL